MTLFSELCQSVDSLACEVADPGLPVSQLFYDSRLIRSGAGGVFFALSSPRSDGHRFIPSCLEKGVRQWVVSDPDWADWLKKQGNQNWILVGDVLASLQKLAAAHRSRFSIPVVGITGSNGKTIVKEWLSQLAGADRFVCRSPKSYNSQIGVALSVWNLTESHELGLFEAGISLPGEMAKLEAMIQPQTGILTNLGTAHKEGFSTDEERYREKLLLFTGCHTLILSESLAEKHDKLLREVLTETRLLTWSWTKSTESPVYNLVLEGKLHPFALPFRDEASLENLGNALAAAIWIGISPGILQNRLHLLNQPEMRLSLKEGFNGNVLIDDSYTNDLTGLEAALQFAALQRKENQELILVLSDPDERPELLQNATEHVTRLLESYHVNRIWTIGEQLSKFPFPESRFPKHFESAKLLLQDPATKSVENAIILVKGARKFRLETLVKGWQRKVHGTRLEINLDAMVQNLNFYRSQLPPVTGVMAMVKALGYGSGDEEIARLLEFHHVSYLAVAYADEGIKLREAGISLPIMVMNPTEDALQGILNHQLEPEIYSFRILRAWIKALENHGVENPPLIHLKVDTGMHRLGFLPGELPELIRDLNLVPGLGIASVFSHLAGADEENLSDYSQLQIRRFNEFCSLLKEKTGRTFRRHILNSAGILRFPEAHFEMVRLGIGLYGIEVNSWFQNQLRPVSTLKTTISQIKEIQAGESVGYGRRTILERNSRIATIAIGYSDGFRRDFSQGKAKVKCGGKWVPVVGNVCMDMCMIDVTDTEANEGDEVILFDDADSLLQLAKAADTIAYEILTGIGHRVKRVFFRE